jgi:dolichol kinase
MTIRDEIIRKTIHLMLLVIPILYLFLERQYLLWMLGGLILIAVMVEIARFQWAGFSRLFHRCVGQLLRDHERLHVAGSTYLLIGIFFTILLFDKAVAVTAMVFVVVADALGALIGRIWGRHRLYGNKTVEGSVVFFLAGLCIVFLMMRDHILIGIAGVIVAGIVDIFIQNIDDNLTIPLGAGAVMHILMKL